MSRMTFPLLAASTLALLLAAIIGAQQQRSPEQEAERERQFQEGLRAPRPIDPHDTIWIEEMTWMEVRDALEAGRTTAIISSGGIEQNGPYVATGKHNYILYGACEGIARQLGNALCAPVLKLVPEGNIDPPSGHMRYPGTISLRAETFHMVLEDVARSLKAHGFSDIVMIGDSGGNQKGMEAAAVQLNKEWTDARVHFIPEFYQYADLEEYMEKELGIEQPIDEGLHDNYYITSLMMVTDPNVVRYNERVRAGKATINGVSIAPKEKTIEVGKKLMQVRVDQTVKAIRESMAKE